ncbi:MAG TPA: ABC transporter permease [Chloroflexota bacterium]|nr:ABC transporter permease [Chloroflexota bacterium]
MISVLRNMMRRKLRTLLTVLGILIGVFALTVMGAMAEKMNLLLAGGVEYYSGHVTVTSSSDSGFSGAPISTALGKRLARVDGAAAAVPVVGLTLKGGQSATFGIPDMVTGFAAGFTKYDKFKLYPAQGRLIRSSDRGVAMVGSELAREYKLHVGQTFRAHGTPLKIVGILQATMTAPDQEVMVSLHDVQQMFLAQLPPMLRKGLKAGDIASAINVYPKPNVNGDLLAARIKRSGIPGIKVSSPSDMRKQFDQMTVVFNVIVMGSAIIALVVGSLSVINTMAMSVAERVKEIGLKKALGAHTVSILQEYLMEAAVIGFIGGLAGLGLGSLLVNAINSATTTTQIFAVTGRLAIGAVLFATILGVAAGFLPALRAARLNPVDALRSE